MAQAELFQDEYKVDLEVFEGPLDLLLYLIRREELDIYDIPIGRITAQYMEYLDLMRQLNLDVAGEFVVMAATLMVIKSRMLLPVTKRTAEDGTDEEWVDPRLDLVRQLIEYKKFKDAAGKLGEYEAFKQESFDYGGGRPKFEKTAADAQAALEQVDLFDLLTAFQEVLSRLNEVPQEELKGMRWSVPDKMDLILDRARTDGQISFSHLFTQKSPRGEVIVTFLALLELLRQHRIVVYQNAAFHEITVLPLEAEFRKVILHKFYRFRFRVEHFADGAIAYVRACHDVLLYVLRTPLAALVLHVLDKTMLRPVNLRVMDDPRVHANVLIAHAFKHFGYLSRHILWHT